MKKRHLPTVYELSQIAATLANRHEVNGETAGRLAAWAYDLWRGCEAYLDQVGAIYETPKGAADSKAVAVAFTARSESGRFPMKFETGLKEIVAGKSFSSTDRFKNFRDYLKDDVTMYMEEIALARGKPRNAFFGQLDCEVQEILEGLKTQGFTESSYKNHFGKFTEWSKKRLSQRGKAAAKARHRRE